MRAVSDSNNLYLKALRLKGKGEVWRICFLFVGFCWDRSKAGGIRPKSSSLVERKNSNDHRPLLFFLFNFCWRFVSCNRHMAIWVPKFALLPKTDQFISQNKFSFADVFKISFYVVFWYCCKKSSSKDMYFCKACASFLIRKVWDVCVHRIHPDVCFLTFYTGGYSDSVQLHIYCVLW